MIFKTTETGIFVELVNWEGVRDAYAKQAEMSHPKKLDSAGEASISGCL